MPVYQYACPSCGHSFEQRQSFSDAALTECPECGGPLRKVFNSVGVVFKGSGFYSTDSRSGTKTGSSDSKSTSSDAGSTSSGDKNSSGDKGTSQTKKESPAKDSGSSGTTKPAAKGATSSS